MSSENAAFTKTSQPVTSHSQTRSVVKVGGVRSRSGKTQLATVSQLSEQMSGYPSKGDVWVLTELDQQCL